MNNSSFFTADRATHLKIVVMSLIASLVIAMVGISLHPRTDTSLAQVYRPGHTMAAIGSLSPTVIR